MRRVFLVEAAHGCDALVRVLGPFAVQAAQVCEMTATEHALGVSVRLEVSGLGEARAQHLAERLRALASVTSVAVGWRAVA